MKRAVFIVGMVLSIGGALFAEGQKDRKPASEGPYDVRWVIGTWGSEVDPKGYFPAEIAKKFLIKLKMEYLPQKELNSKYTVLVASGDLPEIMTYSGRDANFVNWALDGVFYDITDLWKSYPALKKEIPEETVAISTVINGRTYGLPIPKENVNHGLGIRKDWLDKFGMPIPKTLDDIVAYAKKVTFEDPDGNGKADTFGFGLSDSLYSGFAMFRATFKEAHHSSSSWKVPGKELEYNFLKPTMKDYVAFLRRCYQEGVIDPASLTIKDNAVVKAYNEGKYGLINQNIETNEATKTALSKNVPAQKPVHIVIPPVSAGYTPVMSRTNGFFRMQTITAAVKTDAEAKAILSMFDWMLGDGYEFISFGKEGVHWNGRQANGLPALTEAWHGTPPTGENWVNLWLALRKSSPAFLARPEVRGTPSADEYQKNIEMLLSYSKIPAVFVEKPIDPILTDRRKRAEDEALTGVMEIILGARPIDDLKKLQDAYQKEAGPALQAENASFNK